METPDTPVTRAEAEPFYKKVLKSAAFTRGKSSKRKAHCRKMFEALYEQLWSPEEADTGQVFVAGKLGLEPHEPDLSKVRQAKAVLEKMLASYNKHQHEAIVFEFAEDGYRLVVRRQAPEKPEKVALQLDHRRHPGDLLRSLLRKHKESDASEDVLFVTISPDMVVIRIRAWLEKKILRADPLRVLIWGPSSPNVAADFAYHLGEDENTFYKKVEDAWGTWITLAEQHPFINVRRYRSTPTMMGIIGSKRMQVELLPFNAPDLHEAGAHARRPALILDSMGTPASFRFFKDAFEDLWEAAKK